MTALDIVANPAAPHQTSTARALAAGAESHGVRTRIVDDARKVSADIAACWGWRNGKQLAARGACVLVMERGYAGDRMAWTSLGWNGLNGRAQFPAVADGGERWRKHFDGLLSPIKTNGDYALILGQVSGDAALGGRLLTPWYQKAAERAIEFGLRPVFRPHPEEILRRGPLAYSIDIGNSHIRDFGCALSGASVAIAWNSNALTDAAIAGVPVIAGDRGAMAWPVAAHGFEASLSAALGCAGEKIRDREVWAHRLAWCQWTLDEIAAGDAWEALAGDVKPWT